MSILQECISDISKPMHPYYHYLKACCHARFGEKALAVDSLRHTVQNGWCDFQYFLNDQDLVSLKDYEPFKALCCGGQREIALEDLTAGQTVTLGHVRSHVHCRHGRFHQRQNPGKDGQLLSQRRASRANWLLMRNVSPDHR